QHVGEQTYAVRHRLQEEGQDLDKDDQRQNVDRNARGYENLEKFQPVLVEAVDQYRDEDQERQRHRDDDVARNRERVGNDADQVRDADEHEQGEHQREELHAFRAGGAADRAGDELVGEFGDRLQPSRYQLPSRHAANH